MWPLDARVSTPYSVSRDEVVPIFLGLGGGHDRKRAGNISFLKEQKSFVLRQRELCYVSDDSASKVSSVVLKSSFQGSTPDTGSDDCDGSNIG